MDRRNFIKKSAGIVAFSGLLLLGCKGHSEKEKKTFTVVAEKCKGCRKCVKACKQKAITVENHVATINQQLCKGCGDCLSLCKHNAIVQTA